MKHLFHLSTAAALTLGLASCTGDDGTSTSGGSGSTAGSSGSATSTSSSSGTGSGTATATATGTTTDTTTSTGSDTGTAGSDTGTAGSDTGTGGTGGTGGGVVAVMLQNATATFSQDAFGGFGVSEAIDGQNPVPNGGNGWAIFPQVMPQTAAFETVADTPDYPSGTKLTFTLVNNFGTEHNLGCFRLAVTDANRDSFADGNEGLTQGDPGDVGADAIWTVVEVQSAESSDGATMTIRDDNSILVQDLNSVAADYTVVAHTPLTRITGIRLEALQDPALPQQGPGLQDSNGNFVLVEFTVEAAPQ